MLSYSTQKIVKVRDKRLGLLYGFFLVVTLAYVVSVVLIGREYLRVIAPQGTVRVVMVPAAPENRLGPEALPYCIGYTGPPPSAPPLQPDPYQCRYLDEVWVAWPSVEQRGAFATTRVGWEGQTTTPACQQLPEKACEWSTTTSGTFYPAQVENFTIFIDHTLTATELGGLALSSRDESLQPRGIFDSNGDKLEPCDDFSSSQQCPFVIGNFTKPGTLDVLALQTLLRAAGITNLDAEGDICEDQICESFRYSGVVLLVNIYYSNMWSFSTSEFEYSYSVEHVTASEFSADEAYYPADFFGGTRYTYNRHGIRLIFNQVGSIGRFDVQTTLVNLVAAMGLLATATKIVDFLMMHVLPDRGMFATAKEELADLGQLKLQLARKAHSVAPLHHSEGPIAGTSWTMYLDSEGTEYFHHETSGETLWEAPPEVLAAPR